MAGGAHVRQTQTASRCVDRASPLLSVCALLCSLRFVGWLAAVRLTCSTRFFPSVSHSLSFLFVACSFHPGARGASMAVAQAPPVPPSPSSAAGAAGAGAAGGAPQSFTPRKVHPTPFACTCGQRIAFVPVRKSNSSLRSALVLRRCASGFSLSEAHSMVYLISPGVGRQRQWRVGPQRVHLGHEQPRTHDGVSRGFRLFRLAVPPFEPALLAVHACSALN